MGKETDELNYINEENNTNLEKMYEEFFEKKSVNDSLDNIDVKINNLKEYRLKKLVDTINEKNIGIEDENIYFEKLNCYSEKEKIAFEIKYILHKLNNLDEKQLKQKNELLKQDLIILRIIGNQLDKKTRLSKESTKRIKQCLIVVELDFNIPISFYSEVEDLYDKKILKNNKKV